MAALSALLAPQSSSAGAGLRPRESAFRNSAFDFELRSQHSNDSKHGRRKCEDDASSRSRLSRSVCVACSDDDDGLDERRNARPNTIKVGLTSRNLESKSKWRRSKRTEPPQNQERNKSTRQKSPKSRTRHPSKSEEDDTDLQFEHIISLDVNAPVDVVWNLWLDLPKAPEWMGWIEKVEILKDDEPGNATELNRVQVINSFGSEPYANSLSRWVCSTTGFEVSWIAKIEKIEQIDNQRILYWKTIEGFSSEGRVSFIQNDLNTTINLSIRHSLPPLLARIMNKHALSSVIEATLKCDLKKFQQIAEASNPESSLSTN